ncbi:MAG: hypothetical protein M9894_35865 [Planctomycetes bacterium]|nr:hypothetical protein [Planctomycetota bacterium]
MATDAALALGVPLAVALALAAAATRLARTRAAAGALALGAATLAGHLAWLGWPATPLVLDGWLVLVAALALVAAAAERLVLPGRSAAALALRALVAAGVGVMLLRAKAPYWEPGPLWGAAGLVAAGVLASGLLIDRAARDRPPAWALAHATAWAGVTAGAVVAAGSLRLGLLAGGVAAATGALAALAVVDRSERTVALARGVAPALAPVLGALVARSHVYGEMPRASVALLVVAPGGAWLAGALRGRLGRATEPVALALVLALAGLAAALAAPVEEVGYPY